MATEKINDIRKWDEFCSRVINKTLNQDIKWRDASRTFTRGDSVSPLFSAMYKTWRILVYRYSYKHYFDEEDFTVSEEVAIELIDNSGMAIWSLPKVPHRHRLLDMIQYQNSDAQSLLDAMLSEDDEDA